MSSLVEKKIVFNSLPFEKKRSIVLGIHSMFTGSACLKLFYECYTKDTLFDVKDIKFLSNRVNSDLSRILSLIKYKIAPADSVQEDKIIYEDASSLSEVLLFFCNYEEDAQLRILEKAKEFTKQEKIKHLF